MFARPLVHAKPGHVLLQVDYKAQEVGLSAAIFGDDDLIDAFNNFKEDLYFEIGQRMGECPAGSVKEQGNKAKRDGVKTGVLALMYGGGVPAVTKNLHCLPVRASIFIDNFKQAFPKLYKGRDRYLANCRYSKIALNPFGLERKWQSILFKSTGPERSDLSYLNFPVQSAGSCILMRVLADLPDYLQPTLLMHDALLFEVPEDAAVDAEKEASAIMKAAAEDLFPELKIRTESQAAFRFHKDNPASLHEFCAGLGVTLTEPIGAQIKL